MPYDPGAAIRIESTHTTTTPFSTTEVAYSPTTVTVTIKDPTGNDVTSEVDKAMTEHATGQFYYVLQTTIDYDYGEYKAVVTATGPSYNIEELTTFTLGVG